MNVLNSTALRVIAFLALGAFALSPFAALANDSDDRAKETKTKSEIKSASATVQIGPSNTVHVQGASVSGVGSNSVTAKTAWGQTTLSWTILVGSSTELVAKKGGKISLSDVKVGDIVNFQGKLDPNASSLTVQAKVFRDVSFMRAEKEDKTLKDIFQGTLQSLSATTSPTTLQVKIGDKTFTINVTSSTLVLNKNFAPTSLASFLIGDTIRIYGSVSAATSTTLNALIVRDATR